MVNSSPEAVPPFRSRAALITGVSGLTLTADEAAFLKDARPCGLILFARNCRERPQVVSLVEAVRDAIGAPDLLVLIDQEGGRVQRLRPPLSRALPPAENFARLHAVDRTEAVAAAFDVARLNAHDLASFGVNCNCAPVLDVPVAGAHDIIGDRAYGQDPQTIIALARATAEGYLAGGILPVLKHIPGHGRATADSHLGLPVVTTPLAELQTSDFAPFRALADLPAAMTAHVVYTALDANACASTSPTVIAATIRDWIGFDGLLMSDDLSMQALAGSIEARARDVIRAGCDVALHCNGDLDEMRAAARAVPQLTGKPLARVAGAYAVTGHSRPFDEARATARLATVLGAYGKPVESV